MLSELVRVPLGVMKITSILVWVWLTSVNVRDDHVIEAREYCFLCSGLSLPLESTALERIVRSSRDEEKSAFTSA